MLAKSCRGKILKKGNGQIRLYSLICPWRFQAVQLNVEIDLEYGEAGKSEMRCGIPHQYRSHSRFFSTAEEHEQTWALCCNNDKYIYFQYCFTVTCMAHRKCSEGICYFSFLKLFISTDFCLRYYQPGARAVVCICHTLNSNSLSLSLSSPNKERSSSSSSPPLHMVHFGVCADFY